MPKPPPSSSSSSDRGRPPRSTGKPGSPKTSSKPRPSRSSAPRESEGTPWQRRADDAAKLKKAGWGSVARKGAGRVRDTGPGDASKAFREASPEGRGQWEPEIWIDEGEVQGEATQAVSRGRSVRRNATVDDGDGELASDPSLRRAVATKAAERLETKVKEASKAFRRERFEEARAILRPLAEQAPTVQSVRELLGLCYYRLGRWKLAVTELEAFRGMSGSTEQNPVLADCYRAVGRHRKVVELWEELRAVSPSASLVAEGRIVYAGSLADQGRLTEAIAVLEQSKPPAKKPQEHHLRVTYALADLYERAGDVPKARHLFGIVAAVDPDLGDVTARLRALR
jgi:tetratricopeptide (TPR) repeat protein